MNKDSKTIISKLKKNGIKYSISLIKKEDLFFIENLSDCKAIEFEGPDLLFENNAKIYAIEHFEVDGSEIKKGSKFKSEYNYKITKGINKEIESELKYNSYTQKKYSFKSSISYKNLVKNLYSSFKKHYQKIDGYINKIKEELNTNKEIKCIFFIEYTDQLPYILMSKGSSNKEIYPHMDINFLNFFKDKNSLMGIIFSSKTSNVYIPIMPDGYKNIPDFTEDFSDGEIHSFQPNLLSFGIKI